MTTSRLIRAPLWATLVAALVAALVSYFVFVQSGEAAPASDDQSSATKAAKASYQIVGGKPVPDGKYPFMVAIFDKKKPPNPNNPYRMICAGTLIDENSVLTAGHCLLAWPNYKEFYSPQRLLVTVGPTVLTSGQGQVRSVKRFSVHPDFKEFEGDPNDPYWLQDKYDAGVIELNRPVSGIAPIKLATSKQNYLERPGRNATVAGWGIQLAYQPGADFPPESVVQERMREAQVPIVSDSRAKQIYTDYIPPILIAAGGKGKDACLGDSGGPMFARNGSSGGKYTQIGITSYGAGCGAKGVPGVYAEVNNPSIRSFITKAARTIRIHK